MTQKMSNDIDKTKERLPREELARQLDEALVGTFPASDPVSVGEPTATEPERPAGRRPPRIDPALVDELAREVERKLGASEG
jgi:hypothetical protein